MGADTSVSEFTAGRAFMRSFHEFTALFIVFVLTRAAVRAAEPGFAAGDLQLIQERFARLGVDQARALRGRAAAFTSE